MPCLPGHRSTRLNARIILAEVAALVVFVSAIAAADLSVMFWLVGLVTILLHTILFYHLGRISERNRTEPSPDFLHSLKDELTERPG